jgi:GTP pyrophosphokinase
MIHTDVGNQCVGARVNGKMVPLRTRLQNGDIVAITTQTGHKPSRDWLTFVVTSRARSKIKHVPPGRRAEPQHRARTTPVREGGAAVRPQSQDGARKRGACEICDGVRRAEARGTACTHWLRQAVGADGPPEIGARRSAERTARRFRRRLGGQTRPAPGAASDKIKVRGTDDIMVFRAKCCNPIRGEKIVGYITRGKGVSVHAATCPNVLNLMFDPERRIDVEWDTTTSDQAPYTVRLTMQVEDRKGMLAEISAKVSDINTNITNMEARTGGDQQARIDMTVEISDLKHLERVIKSIKVFRGCWASSGQREPDREPTASLSGADLQVRGLINDGDDVLFPLARRAAAVPLVRLSAPAVDRRRSGHRRRSSSRTHPCRQETP